MVTIRKPARTELLTAGEVAELLAAQVAELAPAWAAHQPDLAQRIAAALDAGRDELLLPPMSYEEFLAWAAQREDDHKHAEWINGKVEIMSPVSTRHQAVVVFLVTYLSFYVTRHALGQVFTAPTSMRLRRPPRGREPDVCFVSQENAAIIGKQYLDGPADLVIEVISPESAPRDRGVKYAEYESAGVTEYWIIDPDQGQCDFFVLDPSGRYTQVASGRAGTYTSTVIPALTVDLQWFGQDPLPPVWELVGP